MSAADIVCFALLESTNGSAGHYLAGTGLRHIAPCTLTLRIVFYYRITGGEILPGIK